MGKMYFFKLPAVGQTLKTLGMTVLVCAIVFNSHAQDLVGGSKKFYDGLRFERRDGKYGFVDPNGATVIPFIYGMAGHFSEGLAAVMKDGMWGYINKAGSVVIEPQYGYAGDFHEGLAAVSPQQWMEGKIGYIDIRGEVVIPFVYRQADDFRYGLAPVQLDDKYGCIDTLGNVIIPFVYDGLSHFSSVGLAVTCQGMDPRERKYGYIDRHGNETHGAPSFNTYLNERFGFCIDYPFMFVALEESGSGDGRKFRAGNAMLVVYRDFITDDDFIWERNMKKAYTKALAEYEADNIQVAYKVVKKDFFVISGYDGESVFYRKTISPEPGVYATAVITYDRSEKILYDPLVERIFSSFKFQTLND